MRSLLAILALFSFSLSAVTTVTSNGTGGGPANSTSTWAGGVVPNGTGYAVVIAASDTVTDNIPTWTVGGLIQVEGDLKLDGAGIRNYLFASTGTVWGTSMFGFDVCQSGTLDFSASTQSNYVTVNSVNGTSPIAFHADSSCGSYGDAVWNLQNVIVASPCGSSAASIQCINVGFGNSGSTPSFQLIDAVFSGGGWDAIQAHSVWGNGGSTLIENNLWIGFSADTGCNSGTALICDYTNYSEKPILVENNVAMNPQSAMTFYQGATSPNEAFSLTLSGNGWFSSSAYEGPLLGAGSWGGNLLSPILTQYNVVGDVATTYYSNSNTPDSIVLVPSNTTNIHTDQYEIYDGTGQAGGTGTAIYQYNIGITPNVRSVNACQGCGGVLQYNGSANTTNFLFAHNVCVTRNVGLVIGSEPVNTNICFHSIGNGGTNGTTESHNTVIASLPDAAGESQGLSPGESTGNADVNVIAKDNLVFGWTYGIEPDTSNTYNATACTWGGAACNNWTAGNTNNYSPSAAQGNHWDNGTAAHPSATYGDISSVSPVWSNMPSGSSTGYAGVGPYRGLVDYDALIGGPGTMADLANCMALFNVPLAATAGITSVAPPSKCDPHIIYATMASWYQPLNINQAKAASDGAMPGAFPPLVMGSWIQ
jgi:hypothetical protein